MLSVNSTLADELWVLLKFSTICISLLLGKTSSVHMYRVPTKRHRHLFWQLVDCEKADFQTDSSLYLAGRQQNFTLKEESSTWQSQTSIQTILWHWQLSSDAQLHTKLCFSTCTFSCYFCDTSAQNSSCKQGNELQLRHRERAWLLFCSLKMRKATSEKSVQDVTSHRQLLHLQLGRTRSQFNLQRCERSRASGQCPCSKTSILFGFGQHQPVVWGSLFTSLATVSCSSQTSLAVSWVCRSNSGPERLKIAAWFLKILAAKTFLLSHTNKGEGCEMAGENKPGFHPVEWGQFYADTRTRPNQCILSFYMFAVQLSAAYAFFPDNDCCSFCDFRGQRIAVFSEPENQNSGRSTTGSSDGGQILSDFRKTSTSVHQITRICHKFWDWPWLEHLHILKLFDTVSTVLQSAWVQIGFITQQSLRVLIMTSLRIKW